jgi:hypothetical protein
LEVIRTRELTDEEITGLSQRSEYEVDVRWSSLYEDVRPETQERPPLKPLPSNVTKNPSLCDSDLWSVVTSCKIVQ